ncbi:hypothetical protein ACRU1U_20080, partial [Providencia stuartii]|uniref:hypothetical protein n=1 Tax=Providencia stuartii TaxID=588 RepID=UPI003D7F4F3F
RLLCLIKSMILSLTSKKNTWEKLGKAFDFESGILDENIVESESIEEKEKVRILNNVELK